MSRGEGLVVRPVPRSYLGVEHTMRFPEPVRMADDTGPVWARTRRRSGGNPIIGLLVTILALFGALTAVLSIKEQSVAEGGAIIDGWISTAWNTVRGIAGETDAAAGSVGEAIGDAASQVGDAAREGADRVSDAASS